MSLSGEKSNIPFINTCLRLHIKDTKMLRSRFRPMIKILKFGLQISVALDTIPSTQKGSESLSRGSSFKMALKKFIQQKKTRLIQTSYQKLEIKLGIHLPSARKHCQRGLATEELQKFGSNQKLSCTERINLLCTSLSISE